MDSKIKINPSEISIVVDDLLKAKKHLVKDVFSLKSNTKKEMKTAGVYVFWWDLSSNLLKERLSAKDFTYLLKGPYNSQKPDNNINVKFSNKWIDVASFDNHLCLYIGKSTNIAKRINGHIKYNIYPANKDLSSTSIWKDAKPKAEKNNKEYTKHLWKLDAANSNKTKFGFGRKPNTVSQLRIGLERIFQEDAHQLIMDHVKISFLPYPKSVNAINRFFMEDLLIGTLHPLLNIDVER